MKTFSSWFQLAVVAVVLLLSLSQAVAPPEKIVNVYLQRDDAYYYYKVAQNISEGHGSTFDGINPTNGYHPLWMLVCIPIFALARLDLILPLRIVLVVIGILRAGAAVLFFRLLRGHVSLTIALLAAAFWAFSPDIGRFLYAPGLESALAALLVLASLLAASSADRTNHPRSHVALGIIGGVTILARLDLVFLIGILTAWVAMQTHPARTRVFLTAFLGLIITASTFAIILGTPDFTSSRSYIIVEISTLAIIFAASDFLSSRLPLPPALPLGANVSVRAALVSISSVTAATLALRLAYGISLLPGAHSLALASCLPPLTVAAGVTNLLLPNQELFKKTTRRSAAGPATTPYRNAALLLVCASFPVILYVATNYLSTGMLTPVSGQIKYWWGSHLPTGHADSLFDLFGLDPKGNFFAWGLLYRIYALMRAFIQFRPLGITVASALVTFVAIAIQINRAKTSSDSAHPPLLALMIAALTQILAYSALGYAAANEWYWILQPMVVIFTAALVLDHFLRSSSLPKWLVLCGPIIPLMLIFVSPLQMILQTNVHVTSMAAGPQLQAEFLASHVPPGSLVGMTGAGAVGYLSTKIPIVNIDGLINSAEYFRRLRSGDAPNYLYSQQVKYTYINPTALERFPYRQQFAQQLTALTPGPGGLVLYELHPKGGP